MSQGEEDAGVAKDEYDEGDDGGEDKPGPDFVVMSVGCRHCHLSYVLVSVSGLLYLLYWQKLGSLLKHSKWAMIK